VTVVVVEAGSVGEDTVGSPGRAAWGLAWAVLIELGVARVNAEGFDIKSAHIVAR
jgi:hypothetical protein